MRTIIKIISVKGDLHDKLIDRYWDDPWNELKKDWNNIKDSVEHGDSSSERMEKYKGGTR